MSQDAYRANRFPTQPIPRAELPPVGPAPCSGVEMYDENDRVTMLECPACARCSACSGRHFVLCATCPDHYTRCPWCARCTYCDGENMVTPERAVSWEPNDPDAA